MATSISSFFYMFNNSCWLVQYYQILLYCTVYHYCLVLLHLYALQGCQLSRIWRDSRAFDLLLTQLTNLLTHLKEITRILTQFYKIENNLLFLIIVTFVRLSVTLFIVFLLQIIRCKFHWSLIKIQYTPKRTKLLYFSKFFREYMPPIASAQL